MSPLNDRIRISSNHQIGIESKQVLDSLPDGITIQDRDFNVIYQNRAMIAGFGDTIGKKCYAAYERRNAQCEGCGIVRVFQTGEPTLVLRTAFDAQGGTSYWENACFPVRGDNGNIMAAAEVCRNITDRVGLEEEVKLRNIELGQLNTQLHERTAELTETLQKLEREIKDRERADLELRHAQKLQAVGQLAAGIAHEINTPLQFVGDNIRFVAQTFEDIQLLIGKYRELVKALSSISECAALVEQVKVAEQDADLAFLEENIPSAFSQAQDGMSRISQIVGAMKEFARSDGRQKVAADLNRALEVALTIAKNEYKYVADVETDFGEIPPVMCHLGDINQVFLNLLVNAAHAIAEVVGNNGNRGCIRVRSASEGNTVRIDISDTGCGIPESARERVFEPFFTTKPVGRGSGQGLAIARSIIVDKHGGSLTFESQLGGGTVFTILLPVVPPA